MQNYTPPGSINRGVVSKCCLFPREVGVLFFLADFGLAYKTQRKVEVLGVPCEAHFLARRDSGLRPGGGRRCDFRTFAYKARVKTTPPEAGCPDPPPYHFSGSSLYNFSGIIVSTKVLR